MSGANSSPEQANDAQTWRCTSTQLETAMNAVEKLFPAKDLNSKDAATQSDEEMDINNEEVLGAFNKVGEAMEDIEDGSPGNKGGTLMKSQMRRRRWRCKTLYGHLKDNEM
ncbi:hypothetical protein CVT25_007538 [Psilocybe cyanescens]|uniref:Uncharacterized protein n=1 Tax=Psilocybe cyanescens TaxID=93625 RepID=A0A409XGF7_PSICY|nr:hypothetical protein CVT25_007538 [Psilocybe cyanescens]